VKIRDFTITNVPELLSKKGDAWAEFYGARQVLKFD
jgi:DNA primase